MDRIDAMRIFTRVLEQRSFTLAANNLQMPRSTVTDAVKKLEARLGVRLLERTTRHVSPTLDGENFYQRCINIINEVEDAENLFTASNPKGVLRVNVHGTLARHFILPKLPEFLSSYPEIELFMSEGDRLVDLLREGIDCVIRVGALHTEELVARKITMLEEVTVASAEYVQHHGLPRTLEELSHHKMVGYCVTGKSVAMPLEFTVKGKLVYQSLPTSLLVNSAESLVDAARLGLGIIQVPRYHIEKDLIEGNLIELFSSFPPASSPVWVLYPRTRNESPRVRVFIEWLNMTLGTKSLKGLPCKK